MRPTGLLAAFAIVASCLGSARADTPTVPVDYNAPDPHRDYLSYLRALANLEVGNYVIFQIDWFRGVDWIYVTRSSIGQNLRTGLNFQFDYDPLWEDLLAHPLHGSLDFSAARSAGLSFWESAVFPLVGSLQWEYMGERQLTYPGGWRSKPSTNDLLTTGTAGPLLGEVLYRLSSEFLDDSTTGPERVLRELGAAVLSPMRAFNRLYMGDMWKRGAPPERSHPLEVSIEGGLDRVRTFDVQKPTAFDPSALLAFELQYGDLLPTKKNQTLDPLEFFEVYAAFTMPDSQVSGSQVHAQGLLYGWSTDITTDTGPLRDNNVFGITNEFDYQGANIAQFATLSIGPADYAEWRWSGGRKLRLGFDVDWAYLSATQSPFVPSTYDHSFAMGVGGGLSWRLDLGSYGRFLLRSRNNLTTVVDGNGETEVIGYGRLSYDFDVVPHFGFGISPTLLYRRSSYRGVTVSGNSLETQLYVRLHD